MDKTRKPKKKNKISLAAKIVSFFVIAFFVCLVTGITILVTMLQDSPELNVEDLVSDQSTIIYDRYGEQLGEIGSVMRENISYEDLPNVLIDAFIAVEDSRFFEHDGFDIPRFTSALLQNIKTLSFSQGGSTFTMQLVKNTYFVSDSEGTTAARSIERKVQEISLALELEEEVDKKEILELYLNMINFGGTGNIRGIQRAAQYYFGKDVQELNLSESALLAGIINAPNLYNPHNNLEAATERRNTVLYLMYYHGYITETEYQLALTVKVEDLLVDPDEQGEAGTGYQYQAYIDQVVSEVMELTGLDPYVTPMRIYTAMDPDVQSLMDDIQDGDVDGYFTYPDDEFEVASICIDNETGEIVGILGGRNYSYGGELLFNHATEQYNQPGSSIKPLLEYALAFEYLGWATSHVVTDKPVIWAGTDVIVTNSTNTYVGELTLYDAVGNSLNTPAILTLQEVIDEIGSAQVVEYLNALGFDVSLEDFNLQYAIGGSTFSVSCLQLASAQATMMNGGVRVEPHTVLSIEIVSSGEVIEPEYESTQVISEAAAYLVTELLYNNVHGGYANLMSILVDDYATYAKTGTTDWGSDGTAYGIPTGTARDGWMVGSTSQYTVATWIGYDTYDSSSGSNGYYLSNSKYLLNIQGRITNLVLDQTVETFGTPDAVEQPDTVSEIQHILGTFPYAYVIDGMNEALITSGLIKTEELENMVDASDNLTVEDMDTSGFSAVVGANGTISLEWPTYPDEDALEVASSTMDISLYDSDGTVLREATGTRLFDYSWIFGAVRYKADLIVDGEVVETIVSSSESTTQYYSYSGLSVGDQVEVCGYYGYEDAASGVGSNQVCVVVTVRSSAGTVSTDPEVTISGPTSASVDETVSFSATVSNLSSVSSDNFTWIISYGSETFEITGSRNISYVFSSAGTYTIYCYYDEGMLSLYDRLTLRVT